jgi:AcrR family transcriptional regulator
MNRRSETRAATARRPAPKLRARIRETTEQAILAAAEEVFADAGLHAAHMGTIAAKAGVSVGTLYNHFEDREALLAGLLAARHAELIERLDGAIREVSARPLRDRLRALLGSFAAHCEAHRKFVHIVLQREVGRYHQTYPQAWAKKTDAMRDIHARIESEMKRGVKERALDGEMADLAPTFFLGMMRALVIRDIIEPGGDMSRDLDRLIDAFFNGMGIAATRSAA